MKSGQIAMWTVGGIQKIIKFREICVMRKFFFKLLAALNKAFLPSYGKRDLARLSKWNKVIVAYRYWVTINTLD